MTRRPQGVEGVWVNGTRVFDCRQGMLSGTGPGQVLTSFNA